MPGCATRCTTFSRDSLWDAWSDIRYHFGPRYVGTTASGVYGIDLATYEEWIDSKGMDEAEKSNVSRFGKWLIWYLSYGTVEYGNLPTRVRDHTGISCIPCPYDERSTVLRTSLWLDVDEVTSSGIDRRYHSSAVGEHFMQVALRGTKWGFECTYSGCSYQENNGVPYFHA